MARDETARKDATPTLDPIQLQLDRLARRSRLVCGKDDFVGWHRVVEARERHFLAGIKRVEEGLKLGQVWMIRHVARIERFHGKGAPGVFV